MLPEPEKRRLWKAFDDRRLRHENRLALRLRAHWRQEKARILRALEVGGDPELVVWAGYARMVDVLRTSWEETARDFGGRMASRLGGTQKSQKADRWRWNPWPEAFRDFVDRLVGQKVRGILDWTVQKVKDAIRDGQAAGESIEGIAKRLEETYEGFDKRRAHVIARTETGAAANAGTREAARQSGLVRRKTWLSTRDDRVRDDHRDIDGETVPFEEPYSNGLMFPGDPSGPPEQVINCRCVEVYAMGPRPRREPVPQGTPVPIPQAPGPAVGPSEPEVPVPPVLPAPEAFPAPAPEVSVVPVVPRPPVTAEDFPNQPHVDEETVRIWNERIPITPAEFIETLKTDLPLEGVPVEIGRVSFWGIKRSDGDYLNLEMTVRGARGKEVGALQREFKFTLGSVEVRHSRSDLGENFQGKGVSKILIRNSLRLYDRIGVERIRLQANIDVGGYAWARYGFVPLPGQDFSRFYRIRLNRLRSLLSEEDFAEVQRIVSDVERRLDTDPTALWKIADIRIPVEDGRRVLTVGQYLLLNSDWAGLMELSDQVQRARVLDYVGG